MCVSTAIVDSPKATFSTTFAVLRPTPGSVSSAARSRGTARGYRFTAAPHRLYVLGRMIPSPQYADAAAPLGRLFFERVLLPYRSLPPRGFHILMLILGLISLAVGIGFVAIGAWPVSG